MGVISRGVKNAFRNTIRTISITFILALSIAMSLIMLLALKTVQAKISSVKSSIGNMVTVSPAGMRGFEGGGTPLTNENAADIKSLAHVSTVIETLNGRLTTIGADSSNSPFGRNDDNSNARTSLAAPKIQAPTDSDPNNSNGRQRRMFVNGQNVTGKSFSMPISVTGINNLSNLSALNASSFSLTSGSKIDLNSSDNAAMLGKELAAANNLSVGQTFTAYDQTITVQGIFDAGNTFANAAVFMPIGVLQKLSGETDTINSIIVMTDSIDSLSSVQSAIKNKLGDNIDVTTSEQTAQNAVAPLENIKTISLYSLIGSLAAGSIIIFLTMIMIVRERRREIGVLKAIGSSNIRIVLQFISESMVLTLLSSVIGIVLGFIFSNPVLNVLVSNSENSNSGNIGEQFVRGGGGGAMMINKIGGGLNSARSALQNIHAAVGWEIIFYGLLAAIAIAIVGSAIPAFFISKVRPAEVMRAE